MKVKHIRWSMKVTLGTLQRPTPWSLMTDAEHRRILDRPLGIASIIPGHTWAGALVPHSDEDLVERFLQQKARNVNGMIDDISFDRAIQLLED